MQLLSNLERGLCCLVESHDETPAHQDANNNLTGSADSPKAGGGVVNPDQALTVAEARGRQDHYFRYGNNALSQPSGRGHAGLTFDTYDLLQPVLDLYKIALRRHHRVDVLVGRR